MSPTYFILGAFVACCLLVYSPAQARRVRHAPWVSGRGRCASCPAGWGVERRCTRSSGSGSGSADFQDTACTPCHAGQRFSAHHSARSPCLLCARCGPGLFAARPCTPTHDTKCAACYPPPPPARRNQAYYDQCAGLIEDYPDSSSSSSPGLASYGLSQPASPARSKTEMARSILADPGQQAPGHGQGGGRSPGLSHALLEEVVSAEQEDYALLAVPGPGQSLAGPAYSVLTDAGPVTARPPPPPPREVPRPDEHAVRMSWARPSAASVNTEQIRPGARPAPSAAVGTGTGIVGILSRHHRPPRARGPAPDEDMSPEEVGRLML